MLGIGGVDSRYFPGIKYFLKLPWSVGMIGGRPKQAYYFIGSCYENSLVYLDPHLVQENGQIEHNKGEARRISMGKLDPCMGFGFIIRSEEEYEAFAFEMQKTLSC